MKQILLRFRAVLFTVLALAVGGSTLAAGAPFHFGLAKSLPANEATVDQVTQIKLWFTEPPSEGTVSIRVINAAGDAVAAPAPVQDAADKKAYGVTLSSGLGAGAYTVAWRGMGDDGHVVRGTLAFTVAR